jgi:hypothetical protein
LNDNRESSVVVELGRIAWLYRQHQRPEVGHTRGEIETPGDDF